MMEVKEMAAVAATFDEIAERVSADDLSELDPRGDIDILFKAIAEPRVGKRRRKRPEEQGLPDDDAIQALAEAYLDVQSRHWPKLVPTASKRDDKKINQMTADFKRRFLSEDPFEDLESRTENSACAYVRYSDDNSNSRSLAQQLRLILEKAASNLHFIHWDYVFADAAVTGTTAARRGYSLAKLAVKSPKLKISEMYIDEVGRASRDMIEALNLGRMIEDRQKRLIGASDGFDSDSPMSKLMLSIFAALQEMFIEQLRQKVHRGMDDAFRRGDNVGLHPPGYRLEKVLDADGNEVLKANGRVKMKLVVDESKAKVIMTVFRMYNTELKSPNQIGSFLNGIRFCDSVSWTAGRVLKILRNRHYCGIQIRGMTHQVRDRQTGHVTVVKQPRKKWKVRRLSNELVIIPWSEFKNARKRLQETEAAFARSDKSVARSEVYPNALFRPICADCKFPMIYGRSGPYGTFTCGNSKSEAHGCKAKGHKSRRIVEESLLAEIKKRIDAPNLVERIVEAANRFLEQFHLRPKMSTADLDRQIEKERKALNRILALAETADDEDFKEHMVKKRIEAINKRLAQLREQKKEVETANVPAPSPVSAEQVRTALQDLRQVLQGDVAQAATILRKLTGTITIYQKKREGGRGWDWTASFQMNYADLLVHLERGSHCPKSGVWVYLNSRGWTMHNKVVVRLHRPGKVEMIALALKEIEDGGTPRAATIQLATSLNTSYETIKFARELNSGKTIKRRKRKKSKNARVVNRCPATPELIAEIIQLKDVEKWSFPRIGRAKGFSKDKARALYDRGNPEKVAQSIASGSPMNRGGYSHLGNQKYEEIRTLLASGLSNAEVARRAKVGNSTVCREAKRMKAG